MAAGETIFLLLMIALSANQCFCNERFGHDAEHLHVKSRRNDNFGSTREFTIGGNDDTNLKKHGEASEILRGLSHETQSANRLRRSIQPQNSSTNFNISVFTLNDSHFQLTVHWAGRGSKVVVALAKDNNRNKQNGSVVFISYDYGKTFVNKNSLLKIKDDTPAIINRFFNSPVYNSHYVFTDLVHQYIFTTNDYGQTFNKIQLPFVPDVVSLHITNEKVILAMSKNDTEKKLWLSEDFGETWTIMQPNVKSFFWGIKGLDNENVLYIERLEPSGKSNILRHPDFSTNMQNIEVLISEVEDFQLKDKYMFATRRQRLLGSHLANGTLQLWVSYNRGPFQRAIFPNRMIQADFYVADASEDQVFLCVNHENLRTNLYISDVKGIEYSLSLERIMYFNPNGAGSDSWLSFVAEESFAELYKVEGLKGIYIASQLKKGFERDGLGPEDLITVISFDKGGHWVLLKPPTIDQYGKPILCNVTNNCSLHLSQRFNQLYPPSRSTLIRSQSSAVGLIMASGVYGLSLKGHAGIYLSTDAGSSWHKVLDDNYFYTFGDHGGIIVAVKAYLGAGETNELIYSTDEGETWEKLVFSPENIRVYGLMTEPGEKTTIFTLFGSRPDKHQWLIITVDLKPAFSRICNSDDYKQWSPTDAASGEYRHCLLGQQEVYQRRISRTKCFNGRDYEGVVFLEKCECKLEDYSCDVGFKWDEATNRMCVHDKDSNVDPYAIPDPCPPGTFYNRSKGYRKISGDVCTEGFENRFKPQQIACPISSIPEFILFTQRQVINRMSLASEAQVEHLRIPNLRNVIAVEYDFRNNCLYWADVDDDTILSLCLNGKSEPEVLVETNLASIEGLALDWLTNNLYFVDGELAKIEVIRTDIKHMGRLRRTIQAAPTLEKPRGIALHPLRGFMFWTDWGATQPCISRSYLDGSGVQQLIVKPDVYWPNGITIDYHTDRIYWVDAKLDYIASADLNGQELKILIKSSSIIPHPFAIGIYKDWMYWDDWTRQAILVADKFDGSGVQVVASNLPAIMDLKIYDRGIQRGSNPCSSSNCTHLCMKGNHSVVCLCPDGFHIEKQANGSEKCYCDDDQLMDENGLCQQKSGRCRNGSFACHTGSFCIPSVWQCDGDNDCGDGSDELDCDTRTCSSAQFACRSGRCIPSKWRCDSERDCVDGSDEENCKHRDCAENEFRCKNGMCINSNWKCDMDNDCHDGSDEEDCPTMKPVCEDGEFHCKSADQCLHQAWRCDGDTDCHDGSDEENCNNYTCQSWQHQCKNGHCIFKSWVCDGHDDCRDKSDEADCEHVTTPVQTTTPTAGSCSPWLFTCQSSGKCIPVWWKCDRVSDCTDGSDEFNCAYTTTSTVVTTGPPTTPAEQCGENHFRCLSGNCIWQAWVCDTEPDCPNGEDEANCTLSCGVGHVHCLHSAGCIPLQYMCNGIIDCADGSDEHGCSSTELPMTNTTNCGLNSFECKLGLCIPASKRCNGHNDCLDFSDESGCEKIQRDYFLDTLSVDLKGVTKDSLTITWTPRKVENNTQLEYNPAIREFNATQWHNTTTWITVNEFTFTKLKPYTLYFMTVFIRAKGNSHVSTPVTYVQFRTMPDVSSPPRNLSFNVDNSNKVTLKWLPPLHPNSRILGYRLYITPPTPPEQTEIPEPLARSYSVENYFEPGVTYSIWLTIMGDEMESNASNIVSLKIDPASVVGIVVNLKMVNADMNSVKVTWDKLKNVDGYEISVAARRESSIFDSQRLPKYDSQKIQTPPFNVTGLSPGVMYDVKVSAFKGDNRGPSTAIKVQTKGETLKSPRAVQARLVGGTSVQLNWELPNDNRKIMWEYGIYYGTSWENLDERGIAGRTSNLTYRIIKLDSCESYMFTVRIIGPIGLGPAGNVSYVTTEFDHRSPPKRPKYYVKDLIASIEWKSACEGIRDHIGYKVRIHDEILDRVSWFQLAPTQNFSSKFVLNINYGGRYGVQVQTNYNESRLTKPVVFRGPPLPPPYQIKLMKTPANSYELDWKVQNLPEVVSSHRYTYVLSISQNESDFTKAETHEAIEPKYSLSNLVEGRIYYIAVQLKDQNGYLSDRSDVFTFAIPVDNESVVLSTTSIVSILVPVVVILIVLVVAFGVLYMRHKRLQRVTLSFANSHYNTRSGATTFSTGDDLGDFVDEEDSPMIRGFSDDEPLVIA